MFLYNKTMEKYKLIDFEKDFDFFDEMPRGAYLDDELLIFTKFSRYIGPLTMQLLPNGGIQSLFNYQIIIKVNNGYLSVQELIVDDKVMSSKQFILEHGNELINKVLF